jgi:hypothetical protein
VNKLKETKRFSHHKATRMGFWGMGIVREGKKSNEKVLRRTNA